MRSAILAISLVLGFAVPALAGDWESQRWRGQSPEAGLAELAEACRPDARRLCYGEEPGVGRVGACLQDQLRFVSPPCRLALDVGRIADACRDDYFRFCPGVPFGHGQIVNCLTDYRRDLSYRCNTALSRRIDADVEQGDGRYEAPRRDDRRYDDSHDRQPDRYVERGDRRDYHGDYDQRVAPPPVESAPPQDRYDERTDNSYDAPLK